jgi:O-methyltransferase
MAKITTTGKFLNVLRGMQLHKAYKKIEGHLPDWLHTRLRSVIGENTFVPLVATEELQPKYQMACDFLIEKIGKNKIGDYLEFGVSHGSSMSIMHQVLKKSNLDQVRLFGFDSFEGMPEIAANEDDGQWRPGQFASSLDATKDFMTRKGVDWSRTFLTKGWFSDTLTPDFIEKHKIKKASLIMVDCDIYTSSVETLNFCKPLIKDTSIVIFDDWIEKEGFGEYRAWTEFLQQNPHFKATEIDTYKPTGKLFQIVNTSR